MGDEDDCGVRKYDCAWLLFSMLMLSARRFAPRLISPLRLRLRLGRGATGREGGENGGERKAVRRI